MVGFGLIIYGMNNFVTANCRVIAAHLIIKHTKTCSASQSDNAAFRCDDEDNIREEDVYQDLCAIQSSIARERSREPQVFDNLLRLLCIANCLHEA
jgi:hypothetical protein